MTDTATRRYLNTKDAANYLGVSVGYLKLARTEGDRGKRTPGPPYFKPTPQIVLYAVRDLDAWLAQYRVERPAEVV